MPANRQIDVRDNNEVYLEITIDVKNDKEVYFTDEEVCFEIKIENVSDRRVKGKLGWFLGRGSGTIDHANNRDNDLQIDLDPGEIHKESLSTGYLTHQSNALIGVNMPGDVDRSIDGVIEISEPQTDAGNMYYQEGFSFTVWDREFYKVNYRRPRRAQYASVALAVLIILVGVLQVLDVTL